MTSLGLACAPTKKSSPNGGKLYWRFLIIGARYCTQSFAACSPPNREAAWIAPQRKAIGLDMLLPASAPVSAPLDGS